jgi:hypothetical protein
LTAVEAEPRQEKEKQDKTANNYTFSGPSHADSVKYILKGAVYYNENMPGKYNIERDTDSTGQLTLKPAMDTLKAH